MNINTKLEPLKIEYKVSSTTRREATDGLVKDHHQQEMNFQTRGSTRSHESSPREETIYTKRSNQELKTPPKKNKNRSPRKENQKIPSVYSFNTLEKDIFNRDIQLEFKKSNNGPTIEEIEEISRFTKKRNASLPQIPKRHLIMAIFLVLIGSVALLVGTIYAITSQNANSGIAFWVIGGLCVLPGLYSAFLICRAC